MAKESNNGGPPEGAELRPYTEAHAQEQGTDFVGSYWIDGAGGPELIGYKYAHGGDFVPADEVPEADRPAEPEPASAPAASGGDPPKPKNSKKGDIVQYSFMGNGPAVCRLPAKVSKVTKKGAANLIGMEPLSPATLVADSVPRDDSGESLPSWRPLPG